MELRLYQMWPSFIIFYPAIILFCRSINPDNLPLQFVAMDLLKATCLTLDADPSILSFYHVLGPTGKNSKSYKSFHVKIIYEPSAGLRAQSVYHW